MLLLLAVFLGVGVFGFLVLLTSRPGAASDVPPDLVHAINATNRADLGAQIAWANTAPARRRGLLGRDNLPDGQGIYLVPCMWIHMFWMRFAIDAAYLDREGRVLAVSHSLKPWRIGRPVWRADGVLELPAGTLRRTNTQVGHQITFGDSN